MDYGYYFDKCQMNEKMPHEKQNVKGIIQNRNSVKNWVFRFPCQNPHLDSV